ncbi:MAG TPA: M81 family metallopeptidase [Burkholderiales bacterium]|nr:M81 family metallopeptidase [Burkholderiales bacterium]
MSDAQQGTRPRVAILGFHLESNAFAPVSEEAQFRSLCYVEGDAITREARREPSPLPAEVPAFYAEMDRLGPWTAVPVLVTAAEPGGPVDEGFFQRTLAAMRRGLAAAGPIDAVYLCNHGGMVSTGGPDPDGELYEMARSAVGRAVPVVATVDLHANISERMVANVEALLSYRTNPHMDQQARAVDAARLLRKFLQGTRSRRAFARLPLTPASVTLLTREGPYADAIAYGQTKVGNGVLDVSIVGGFVFSDTPKNGIAVVVNGEGDADVRGTALDIAERIWSDRGRFVKRLTSMDDAIGSRRDGHIWSDSGDNPGGGGSGQTTALLKKLHEAKVDGVLYGIFFEPQLASKAREAGEGASFEARFTEGFSAGARVLKLTDGKCVGRRGIWAGRALELGPTCALQIGGVAVVCVSRRKQCADPVFFEMHGLDVAAARTVVVKSRGHFRGGFDEYFPPERVVEVDTPGFTSPVLERLQFKGLPRPVFPLDAGAEWTRRVAVYE